jgi:riboflavin biosynthesis pyrimidine reductase
MQMLVGPHTGPVGEQELPDAYPWPDRQRWVRSMTVMTLDGATVGPDGRSRSISSVGDRKVLSAVRRYSDLVLIGAGTFRAERYTPMRARAEDAAVRSGLGLAPAPRVGIVSGSLDLPWDEPIFAESDLAPVVVTSEAADPARLGTAKEYAAQGHAELVVLPGPELDLVAMFDRLGDLGLRRVVCEGGSVLLSAISLLGLLDEVDLSIAPVLAGSGQVVTAATLPSPAQLTLEQVIADTDGFLFTRYLGAAQ